MNCPTCDDVCVHWAVPGLASYGWGCLRCRLFWTLDPSGDSEGWQSSPLDMVPYPPALVTVPACRAAVGWPPL